MLHIHTPQSDSPRSPRDGTGKLFRSSIKMLILVLMPIDIFTNDNCYIDSCAVRFLLPVMEPGERY